MVIFTGGIIIPIEIRGYRLTFEQHADGLHEYNQRKC